MSTQCRPLGTAWGVSAEREYFGRSFNVEAGPMTLSCVAGSCESGLGKANGTAFVSKSERTNVLVGIPISARYPARATSPGLGL